MLQVFLLLIAFAAVPWMLIPKPYILKKRHEARMAQVNTMAVILSCCTIAYAATSLVCINFSLAILNAYTKPVLLGCKFLQKSYYAMLVLFPVLVLCCSSFSSCL